MKRNTLKSLGYALGALGCATLGVVLGDSSVQVLLEASSTAGIGSVANTVRGNFDAIADLMAGGAYLGGAGFGIQSALKFKAHNENAQQTKLSAPITYALVAGALLALPSVLTTTTGTLFNSGVSVNTGGGALR